MCAAAGPSNTCSGLILLSATFQQASAPRADALAVDADGRLLWRFPPRRLEAEAIRDSMLAVSGALNLTRAVRDFYLMDVVEENVMHYFPKERISLRPNSAAWCISSASARPPMVFGSFDCPDGGQVMPRRSRSNTPCRRSNLFNSPLCFSRPISSPSACRKGRRCARSPGGRRLPPIFGRLPDACLRLRQSAAMIRRARPDVVLPRSVQHQRVPLRFLSRHLPMHPLLNRRTFSVPHRHGPGRHCARHLLGRERVWLSRGDRIRPEINPANPNAARQPHFKPRAKNVLMIFCSGACSQLDTFDYKPELIRRHGQPMPGQAKASSPFKVSKGP